MGFGGIIGGMIESFTKNVFCDIVKPSIGSIVQVQLAAGVLPTESLCHTGIYVGNDKIVELTKNSFGQAEIRVVSAEHFIEGDDLFPRTGTFIYVACGKNANGSCFALGNHDIARNAAQHIGKIWNGKYDLTENNCHMFCQCCILDGKTLGFELSDIENALKEVFDVNDVYWRSTGESRGSNPCFVDDDPTTTLEKSLRRFTYSMVEAYENGTVKGSANSRKKKSQLKNNKKYDDNWVQPLTTDSSFEEIQKAISIKSEEFMQNGKRTTVDELNELSNLLSDKMKREIAQKIEEIETKKIKQTAEKMTINDEIEATPENIVIMLNKMAEGDEEFVLISADEDGNSFIQSCPNEDEETYILEYRKDDKLYGTVCKKLESVQEAMEKFCLNDFSFVNKYKWALVDLE